MTRFVERINKNGDKQYVPETWVQDGHRFADQFRVSPSQKQRQERSPAPAEDWTVKQLQDHAERAGVDLAGATTKADVLAAIRSPRGDETEGV